MTPLPFSLALLLGAAPFQVKGTAQALGGQVFLGQGELLVGTPAEEGRPGYEPARGPELLRLPDDLSAFRILGESCDREGTRALTPPAGPAQDSRAVAWVQGDLESDGQQELVLVEASPVQPGALMPYAALTMSLYRQGRRVGEQVLDLVAIPCELAMEDVDGDQSPEVVFIWRSIGGSGYNQGATVFELAKRGERSQED